MRTLILLLFITFLSSLHAEELIRDANNLPKCFERQESKSSYYFHYKEKAIGKDVFIFSNSNHCEKNFDLEKTSFNSLIKLSNKFQKIFPSNLYDELKYIENYGYSSTFDIQNFIKDNNLTKYTLETNRVLSNNYGKTFSAKIFKAIIESKKENLDFRNRVLHNIANTINQTSSINLNNNNKDLEIIVSFGLGWYETKSKFAPGYLRNFINEIQAFGIPVTFLKKNPFGTVENNVLAITPTLEAHLNSGKKIIFVSLCKGTPELLTSLSRINEQKKLTEFPSQILGMINLSGMLTGAFFSDNVEKLHLEKSIAKFLRFIPINYINDNAKMFSAIDYMQTNVIQNTLKQVNLDNNMFVINVTGAPMGQQVMQNNSPMIPVLNLGAKRNFVQGANDGFIELPHTLIPENVSNNQLTLILDSSHLLSDGLLDQYRLDNDQIRKSLYYLLLKEVINHESQ